MVLFPGAKAGGNKERTAASVDRALLKEAHRASAARCKAISSGNGRRHGAGSGPRNHARIPKRVPHGLLPHLWGMRQVDLPELQNLRREEKESAAGDVTWKKRGPRGENAPMKWRGQGQRPDGRYANPGGTRRGEFDNFWQNRKLAKKKGKGKGKGKDKGKWKGSHAASSSSGASSSSATVTWSEDSCLADACNESDTAEHV